MQKLFQIRNHFLWKCVYMILSCSRLMIQPLQISKICQKCIKISPNLWQPEICFKNFNGQSMHIPRASIFVAFLPCQKHKKILRGLFVSHVGGLRLLWPDLQVFSLNSYFRSVYCVVCSKTEWWVLSVAHNASVRIVLMEVKSNLKLKTATKQFE